MQTYFLIAATLLYLICGFLPARKSVPIAALTAGAWLLHGAALWADVMVPGSLRVGFATMLSSALWISVGAYWLENQNFPLDGLRRIVMPVAALAVALQAGFPGALIPTAGRVMLGWHIAIATLAYDGAAGVAPAHTQRPARLFRRRAGPAAGAVDDGETAVPPDRLRLRAA
jgi:ABC-type uncharacterized transport system permease subunit